jgi:hypothetical protein
MGLGGLRGGGWPIATLRRVTRSRIPRAPLWLRWVLSIAIAVAILVAIVRFVSTHGSAGAAAPNNPRAEAQANRESEILVREDQAPHFARLPSHIAPATALRAVVRANVASLIAHGIVGGPIGNSACVSLGRARRGVLPFRCAVIAGSVGYPFLGVVDVRARRITYCKRDEPPLPSENIPVSRRCTA